jgi:hypothetical protein
VAPRERLLGSDPDRLGLMTDSESNREPRLACVAPPHTAIDEKKRGSRATCCDCARSSRILITWHRRHARSRRVAAVTRQSRVRIGSGSEAPARSGIRCDSAPLRGPIVCQCHGVRPLLFFLLTPQLWGKECIPVICNDISFEFFVLANSDIGVWNYDMRIC